MFTKEILEQIINDNPGKEIALKFSNSDILKLSDSENSECRNCIYLVSKYNSKIAEEWTYRIIDMSESYIKIEVCSKYYSGNDKEDCPEVTRHIVYYPYESLIGVSVHDEMLIKYKYKELEESIDD